MAWTGLFTSLGYLFSGEIERIAEYFVRTGTSLALLAGGGLAAYILWKIFQRRRFLRALRIARITPKELKAKLDSREDVLLLDVRHPAVSRRTPISSPERCLCPWKRSKAGRVKSFPGAVKSFCTAIDRTRPPAPGRRCF